MWLCTLQLLLLLTTWTYAAPEEAYLPLLSDADDSKDGSLILFFQGRSLLGNGHQKNDIEARRRSTFEKNFMRFGRSRTAPIPNDDMAEDEEFAEDMDRSPRSQNKNDNFIRFGRGSDFIRFGRGYSYDRRSDSQQKENNFIRFGRSVDELDHKRSRRSVEDKQKRGSPGNIVRFGRSDNFMRFGRGENVDDNLVEDGKSVQSNQQQSSPYVSHLRLHDPTLLRLLNEIAEKIKAEKSNWMRLGN